MNRPADCDCINPTRVKWAAKRLVFQTASSSRERIRSMISRIASSAMDQHLEQDSTISASADEDRISAFSARRCLAVIDRTIPARR
jgi:hypothetical protein